MTESNRLAIRGVRKSFGANLALAGLDLTIQAGQTHALVGQNGSGKSTLVKILAGVYSPDAGSVEVNGMPMALPARPRDLRAAGISFVHQTLGLVATKSVAENIAVGDFILRRGGIIDWQAETAAARLLLARIGSDIDPTVEVGRLGPADQSKVAIARAIRSQSDGTGALVLDEPSRALPPDALREFHATIRGLVAQGTGVLLISHNLEEVMSTADRITVLRDGRIVASDIVPAESSEHAIATHLLGHELVPADKRERRQVSVGGPAMRVAGLSIAGVMIDPLEIRRGEVLGITGLAGDLWERIPSALAGVAPPDAGTLTGDGPPLDLAALRPRRAIDAGIALVPERRLEDGIAALATIAENVALPWYRSRRPRGPLNWRSISRDVLAVMRGLDVRPLRADAVVGHLSGGNQQKVLLGKWLMRPPVLLLLHEPTQAVDVGARNAILRAVRRVAAQGAAVLYASAQPTDLAEVSDRILAYANGRMTEIDDHSQAGILDAVYQPDAEEER